MQHLGPKFSTGKWIMIISELEQQKHTWAHPLISDQLAVMRSLALLVVLSMLQHPQDKAKETQDARCAALLCI